MKRQNKTLLLVEDDENDRLFMKRAWNKISPSASLQMVENGREAIAYLDGIDKYSDRTQFEFPTMIVTDLKMALGTGFDVLKHIRSKPEWAVVPTVVLSASSDTDDIKKSYLMGANAYLLKPTAAGELDALLHVLHDFWIRVEVPQVHSDGDMKATEGEGKLGQHH